MNKSFSLLLFLLMLSLLIVSSIESHIFIAQPNGCSSNLIPVYLNLNESKDIIIYLYDGLAFERWITINQSGLARFTPNVLVILESQYPFEVNGKPAWYNNATANYFYEFRANESMTLIIDFLPKALPNTPTGYINLDSSTPVPANETTSQIKPIVVKSTTSVTTINSSGGNQIIFLVLLVIVMSIIAVLFLLVKKK